MLSSDMGKTNAPGNAKNAKRKRGKRKSVYAATRRTSIRLSASAVARGLHVVVGNSRLENDRFLERVD